MRGNLTKQGKENLQSNLQKAQTARALQLLLAKDFNKRSNGENSQLEEALHGDFDAGNELKREQPHHRTMINMASAGYTNQEISNMTGFAMATVSNTLRQPWARQYLINQAKKTVQDEIKAILEKEAIPSIQRLVQLRDSAQATAADKGVAKQAADSLLDRFLGKPVQPMTTDAKPVAEMSETELKEQVMRELQKSQVN